MLKNIIILAVLLFALNSFGFDRCYNTMSRTPINVEQVVQSESVSFAACPESILFKGTFVRHLTRVTKVEQKTLCGYGHLGLNITCLQED